MRKNKMIKTIIEKEINETYKDVLTPILIEVKNKEQKEQKERAIWITTHKGKLEHIQSINTNSLTNPYCIKRSKNPKSICSKCYSNTLLKIRKGLKDKLEHNSKLLSEKILPLSELPLINALYFRFQSFGDLINMNHYRNLINIARKNPKVNFALWSKRTDIIKANIMDFIPDNLILIYSNPILNTNMYDVPKGYHKVFSVYDSKNVKDNNVNINCGANNCLECKKCYEFNGIEQIREVLK